MRFIRSVVRQLKVKLQKYLSGRLALVQIGAGFGAFVGRSAAVFFMPDNLTWNIVIVGILGSTVGYISTYIIGYWIAFRHDYRVSGRLMAFDIGRLQFVEQLPNIGTFVVSGLTQGALIGSAGLHPVLAVNLGSWFGPHKIINLIAMLASNSFKKAWVDGSWRPVAPILSVIYVLKRIYKYKPAPHEQSATKQIYV